MKKLSIFIEKSFEQYYQEMRKKCPYSTKMVLKSTLLNFFTKGCSKTMDWVNHQEKNNYLTK